MRTLLTAALLALFSLPATAADSDTVWIGVERDTTCHAMWSVSAESGGYYRNDNHEVFYLFPDNERFNGVYPEKAGQSVKLDLTAVNAARKDEMGLVNVGTVFDGSPVLISTEHALELKRCAPKVELKRAVWELLKKQQEG